MKNFKTILALILSTSITGLVATIFIGTWIAAAFTGPPAGTPGTTEGSIRINSATGNVGIGVAPSTYKLDVNGALRLQPTATAPTGANGVIFYDPSVGVDKFRCYEGGAWKDCVGSGAGATISAANVSAGQFGANTGGGNYSFPAALGIGVAAPNAAAILQLDTTSKGFLPPRMTTANRNSIASPAAGLMIYNTDDQALNYYNGTSWIVMGTYQ